MFYKGLVLHAADPHYGLVALAWDVSVLLRYAMQVVGGGTYVCTHVGRYNVFSHPLPLCVCIDSSLALRYF